MLDSRGTFVRSFTLAAAGVTDFVVLDDGTVVVNASVPTPERAGLPLHLYTSRGEFLRSMGAEPAILRADLPALMDRKLAASVGNRIWSVRTADYVIEQWDVEGRQLRELTRRAAWFRSDYQMPRPSLTQPPASQVTGVREDHQGRLWIVSLTADSTWRRGLAERQVAGRTRYSVASYDEYFDTVIDVIDPSTSTLLATKRLDQCLPLLLSDGYLGSFGSEVQGVPVLHVWRVQFVHQ